MDEKLINFEANFSVLDRYGEDVTANTFITNPAIGRDEQIKELILVLLTPEKSAILIGKPGIGKTAIVEGLAYRMQKGEVPDALKGYTIINIKTASLLGTMPSGESKVQKMIDELKTRDKIILFVDEIHMLIGATDSSSLDFANIFKEGLGRGSIKVIGATTTEEYERYILRDKAFTRRFQKIEVPEPTREETIKIMMGTLPKFEKQTARKMKYTPFIQERIMSFLVDITSEYKRVFALGSRYPDVCLTLLKQAFSYTVYDNRQYMDIFDIRKAIENSKNIYPDVIKKELPRFDKEFNDIILEEKGEKPVEEWRKENGPTRYEQAINDNIISATNAETDIEDELKTLESIPSMIDKETLRDRKPVKAIISEKTLGKFAKIGPTAISKGLKDKLYQNNDSKNIDDILLSSEIEIISKDANQVKMPTKYTITEELKPGGLDNLLLGKQISSTLDDYEEKEESISTYKSDNNLDKALDPTMNALILDNPVNNRKENNQTFNNKNNFVGVGDMSFFDKKKEDDNKDSLIDESKEEKNNLTYNNKNDLKSGFLFGAPMYETKEEKKKEENNTDIFGQLLVPDSNMMIRNGKIIDDFNGLKAGTINSKSIIGEVSNNKRNESKTTNPVDMMFQNSNNENKNEISISPKKNWKFIQNPDMEPSSQNNNFNELEINNNLNSSLNNNKFTEIDFNNSANSKISNNLNNNKLNGNKDIQNKVNLLKDKDFVNFNDLNAGKISANDTNKYISFSNPKDVQSNSNIDLKLDEKSFDNDNYFDDFFED